MVSLLCLELLDEWMGFDHSDLLAVPEEKPGNKESGLDCHRFNPRFLIVARNV